MDKKTAARFGPQFVSAIGFGLANKADNPHLPVTLRVDKGICFVHLLDEVGPTSL